MTSDGFLRSVAAVGVVGIAMYGCAGGRSSHSSSGTDEGDIASPADAVQSDVQPGSVRIDDVIKTNKALDADLRLIARLYIGTERAIEWYQPTPGLLVVSEVGPGAGEPILPALRALKLKPSELYHRLAPTLPIPDSLSRLDDSPEALQVLPPSSLVESRIDLNQTGDGLRLLSGASSGTGVSACGSAWFSSNFCIGGWDHMACRINSNGLTGWCTDREHVYTAVCSPFRSTAFYLEITGNTHAPDDFWADYDVPQGTYRWFEYVAYTFAWGADDAFDLYTHARTPFGKPTPRFHYVHLCEDD